MEVITPDVVGQDGVVDGWTSGRDASGRDPPGGGAMCTRARMAMRVWPRASILTDGNYEASGADGRG